jgi:Tfp pilus assembly protein PilF
VRNAEDIKRRALQVWEHGQRHQLHGDIQTAIKLYSESIDICPTAEAHTFRGWAYSFQGKLEDAIAECKMAIEIDPEFGNPYNDIGSYLMKLGNLEEAIPWLERAKTAPRYEPRHFPFLNLGRLYAAKGQLLRAAEEFRGALRFDPGNSLAVQALDQLTAAIN